MTTTIDPQTPGAQARSTEPESGASLEKVRDLLFGVQMRDYDRNFARLEERIAKETGDLRDEVRKRLSAIEAIIQREVESLSDRLKAEQDNRAKTTADFSRELSETAQTFEKKTTQLDDQIARSLREMRQQLHEQEQRLIDELRAQADEIISAADARIAGAAQRQGGPRRARRPVHRNGDASERSVQPASVRGPVGCLDAAAARSARRRRRPRPRRRESLPSCER